MIEKEIMRQIGSDVISGTLSFKKAFKGVVEGKPGFQWLTVYTGKSEKTYTLNDLAYRIYDFCDLYQGKGIREGDIVLIILKESLDLFASFFAGIIMGIFPAYFAYPSEKQSRDVFGVSIRNLVRYNKIKLIVTFSDMMNMGPLIGDKCFAGSVDHETVCRRNRKNLDDFEPPSHEAFLQFSSGTTGAKKGIKISVEALFNQINAYEKFLNYDSSSKVVSWLPHYHDMGLIACMLMPFLKQVPIYMISPFEWVRNPEILLKVVTRNKGTHLWLPNFALGHLANNVSDSQLDGYDLSSLKRLVLCSEKVLYETATRFIKKFGKCGFDGQIIQNCYAMAENTFAMTSTQKGPVRFLEIDASLSKKGHRIIVKEGGKRIACAGKPLSNIEIKIIDDKGNDLSEGYLGGIAIKSDCMLDSYNNNPVATNEACINGYFMTGDLGFFHKEELYISGREKDLLIIAGENIYPEDIELILNSEPSLIPGRNVVFSVDDPRIGTERIVCVAETVSAVEDIDTFSVRAKILDALNISVSEFLIVPHMTLRKGTAGKISRSLNKEEYLKGAFGMISEDKKPIDSPLPRILKGLIPTGDVYGLKQDTLLFKSGLIDSFGFIMLIHGIEEEYGIKIPESMWRIDHFETMGRIAETIRMIRENTYTRHAGEDDNMNKLREESRLRLLEKVGKNREYPGFLEYLINWLPFPSSFIYSILLKVAGVKIGRGVYFSGRINVRFRGDPRHIVIGNNVVFGNNVELWHRGNGKIILEEGVYVEGARLVAARDGSLKIGCCTRIGRGTIINATGNTSIGGFCLIVNVMINAGEVSTDKRAYIYEQPPRLGSVTIGNDSFIGSGSVILMDAEIGEGVVIGANSVVSGKIKPFSVYSGIPARLLRKR